VAKKVSLLFGVHAHQPAGNFEEVLNDAHARCYRPFIETFYRYPDFKLSVHFSGWLLGYLIEHFPADMAKLREMTARGQVEMFGGGDTEPVLASIPERDRRSQLAALSDRLHAAFGQRPGGAWLTERVWESAVAPSLADSGIRYVTVDDYHFLCAGKHSEQLTGYYSTEEGGIRLDLFPISEALRYRIPFSTAPEAIQYLESCATEDGAAAGIYFDDIEKLGIWPETYQWVYEKQWLKLFIEGVLASPLIEPVLYGDFARQHPTRGVVYLPATSYIEMNEWTLDAERADVFAVLVKQEKDQNRYDSSKPFLRGGIWRNFISRYSESNWMHKRMLQVSGRVAALGKKSTRRMRELLHLAQANDAYWHGLFGGIYLPHLRRSVWNAIVDLEALLDKASPRKHTVLDLDLDGHDEIFLNSGKLQAVIRDDSLGTVHELDSYVLRQNFGDTLARRAEHYYRKIRQGEHGSHSGQGIPSAHDRVQFKHPVSPEDLTADVYPRTMFLDRIRDQLHPVQYALRSVTANAVELTGPGLTKRISVKANTLTVEYRFEGEPADFETEINLAMPSCDGFLGRYVVNAEIPGGFGQALNWESIKSLTLEDGVLGGKVTLTSGMPVSISAAPHKTVSQSEGGFEKIMQAVTLRLAWQGVRQTITLVVN
jgi:alpha-amylase/alpha-mannosidase (GH57 family)